MATASVARSSHPARQRRDLQRPGVAKVMTRGERVGKERVVAKENWSEPYVRTSEYILEKHKRKPPSLIVHLHPNHWRFDQQDGSFAYNPPVQFFLKHLRQETVPHEMLEYLREADVTFYDGKIIPLLSHVYGIPNAVPDCLIVEVQNHRDATNKSQSNSAGAGSDANAKPYSMHTYNEHITPSPYVPYPPKALSSMQSPSNKATGRSEAATDQAEKDKEDMPAPGLPTYASKQIQSGPTKYLVVLHPTALSKHQDMLILANSPADDKAIKYPTSVNREAGTPVSAHPTTPLMAMPSIPNSSKGPPNKKQKLFGEVFDMYAEENSYLVSSEPPLLLDPARTPEEAQRMLDLLRHPLHNHKPPAPKTRKRTTAELAADEAQAAEEERFMLVMDERLGPSAAAAPGTAGAA
ncbi:hypothetical protein LTR28_011244, partial [Elasticomyces elasticus]